MVKFLLSSALLMVLLYLMAAPFVNYYDDMEELSMGDEEHALAADIQLLGSAGSALILVFLAVLYWADTRFSLMKRL